MSTDSISSEHNFPSLAIQVEQRSPSNATIPSPRFTPRRSFIVPTLSIEKRRLARLNPNSDIASSIPTAYAAAIQPEVEIVAPAVPPMKVAVSDPSANPEAPSSPEFLPSTFFHNHYISRHVNHLQCGGGIKHGQHSHQDRRSRQSVKLNSVIALPSPVSIPESSAYDIPILPGERIGSPGSPPISPISSSMFGTFHHPNLTLHLQRENSILPDEQQESMTSPDSASILSSPSSASSSFPPLPSPIYHRAPPPTPLSSTHMRTADSPSLVLPLPSPRANTSTYKEEVWQDMFAALKQQQLARETPSQASPPTPSTVPPAPEPIRTSNNILDLMDLSDLSDEDEEEEKQTVSIAATVTLPPVTSSSLSPSSLSALLQTSESIAPWDSATPTAHTAALNTGGQIEGTAMASLSTAPPYASILPPRLHPTPSESSPPHSLPPLSATAARTTTTATYPPLSTSITTRAQPAGQSRHISPPSLPLQPLSHPPSRGKDSSSSYAEPTAVPGIATGPMLMLPLPPALTARPPSASSVVSTSTARSYSNSAAAANHNAGGGGSGGGIATANSLDVPKHTRRSSLSSNISSLSSYTTRTYTTYTTTTSSKPSRSLALSARDSSGASSYAASSYTPSSARESSYAASLSSRESTGTSLKLPYSPLLSSSSSPSPSIMPTPAPALPPAVQAACDRSMAQLSSAYEHARLQAQIDEANSLMPRPNRVRSPSKRNRAAAAASPAQQLRSAMEQQAVAMLMAQLAQQQAIQQTAQQQHHTHAHSSRHSRSSRNRSKLSELSMQSVLESKDKYAREILRHSDHAKIVSSELAHSLYSLCK